MGNSHRNVGVKFESNGPRRLSCRTLTRVCTVTLILRTIFIKIGTAVQADRPIPSVPSFHQVANTHMNVCAKFESNGPRRLSCRDLTRMCTMALILWTIFIEIDTAVQADRPILKVLSFHQVVNTHRNMCVKFESNGGRRLSWGTLTIMCAVAQACSWHGE